MSAMLTDSAKRTLVAAARLRGEPDEPFTVDLLRTYMAGGCNGYAEPEERDNAALKGKSLHALSTRGLTRKCIGGHTDIYEVTEEGFKMAELISGGRGLL